MTTVGARETSPWPLISVIVTCFFAGALYGWSALIAPLQVVFGVSTAETGLAFSLAIVSFTCAVIALPLLSNSAASPRLISGLGVLGAVFVTLAMFAPNYPLFLLWFSGGFGATSGAIYIVALALAARSPAKAIATPVTVASFGAGGAVFGPLWGILGNAEWGLRGLLFLALGLAASALFAFCTKHTASPPVAALRSSNTTPAKGQNLRRFVLIWLTFAFGSYTGLMVLGMAAKMMDEASLSLSVVSFTLACIAICNTAGRLSAAPLNKHSGLRGCLVASFGATVFGLTAMFLSFAWGNMLAIGLMLLAGGYGLTASTIPLITQIAFDPSEFQRRFSLIFTAWGVAGFCAPWIAGLLFDFSGNFNLALLSAAGSSLGFGIAARLLMKEIG